MFHFHITRKALLLSLLLTACFALFGCGGGGSGGPGPSQNPTTVTGTILDVASDVPPTGATTIVIGGKTATADADGRFTLNDVDAAATTATITSAGLSPRTLALALTQRTSNNLGVIYLSSEGYTATATGTVVTTVNNVTTPVGGAKVTIAGSQTTTTTDGRFSIANLPVGLGASSAAVGTITATGYQVRNIVLSAFALAGGSNDIGPQQLGAPLSTTLPTFPYTVQIKVTSGTTALTTGGSVTLSSGATNLGTALNDGSGNFNFWVVPGTYTATATVNGVVKTTTVTLAATDTPVSATIAF